MYITYYKNKISPEKKSEVKWTEQFNKENPDWKLIYTTSLQATKDINKYNVHTQFNLRYILLGIRGKSNRNSIKKLHNLLGKYVIFKSKYQKQQPNLLRFKVVLDSPAYVQKCFIF